ncbi:hypothetical protein HanIR_Chr08g0358271 [Helianthus annuus]|nr:hypothetical protein HanIR_Chr08g0358271 [Helianthus annuus]
MLLLCIVRCTCNCVSPTTCLSSSPSHWPNMLKPKPKSIWDEIP